MHDNDKSWPLAVVKAAFDAIQLTFCKLARIQFEAPWKQRESC